MTVEPSPTRAGAGPWTLARESDPAAREHLVTSALAHLAAALDGSAAAGPVRRPDGPRTGLRPRPRPRPVEDVLAALVATVDDGVDTRSPRYLGYLPSGARFSAAVGDLLASALNPYSAMASVSPGAVAVEDATVRWLCDSVGLPAGAGGLLTSGGSAATLTAVVAARDALGVDVAAACSAPVYLGADAHHSVRRALHVAGLGACPVRVVPSAAGRMDVGALRAATDADAARGLRPWLVVPTAGTTSTGAVDPVAAVTAVARRHGAWVHADAAYGGLFRLAASAPAHLAGLAGVDSLCVDPHKALLTPYGTGALLVRDPATLRAAFAHDAAYLEAPGEASPADLGPELTRPFRALRVWLPLQLSGTDAVAQALEDVLSAARHVHGRLATAPHLVAGPSPDLGVVTVRHEDPAATADLARAVREDGRWYLTTTTVDGVLHLRVAVGSPRTAPDDLDRLAELLTRCAARLPGAA